MLKPDNSRAYREKVQEITTPRNLRVAGIAKEKYARVFFWVLLIASSVVFMYSLISVYLLHFPVSVYL